MKDLELATLGVDEMNGTELQNTDGGVLFAAAAWAYIIYNWDDISSGFSDGWADGHR